ncbi:hypothetical protein O9G_004024 [Rozella allomycis CSF55]|uniref:Crinkler family protein n=2 Tax=Rozella allomycis (strain CSF55) TaxID=988480 RepID=A0A075AWT7_ROZAC|nr:hypothetical protein O9G_004024 [Rozella allomycis CSF55]|eukprot:EPZ34717.1 hypothetical protein O9G_004024 [Rozella allomycis CSF55]
MKRKLSASNDLTVCFTSFVADAFIRDRIMFCKELFPYPLNDYEIKTFYVRQCYIDVFELLTARIERGKKKFGISGTPGVGKSMFFLYILFRVLKGESSFKPKKIMYQNDLEFLCYEFSTENELIVKKYSRHEAYMDTVLQKADTLYIIDGNEGSPISSRCITVFISSPGSNDYKRFIMQNMATEWYFPVWTLDELKACRDNCYQGLPEEFLKERYLMFGGIARFIFWDWIDQIDRNGIPQKLATDLECALNDETAVRNIVRPPQLLKVFNTIHSLLHIIVDRNYRYSKVGVASDYIAHEICVRHYNYMISHLQTFLGGSPSVISRHLFEIYGNRVFSMGGKKLNCRDLQNENNQESFEIYLQKFDLPTTSFRQNTIPLALPTSYYETSDDDTFPAIDAISPQGMFQFTVESEHPIRGIQVLKKVCKLFKDQQKEPKLFFVVPTHQFSSFKKQVFVGKSGNSSVQEIQELKQYVLELPVGIK